jgi:hypothetical protein
MTRFSAHPLAALFLSFGALLAQEPASDFLRVARPEPLTPVLAASVEGLDSARIRSEIAWLSDPARQGRGLGTQGLDATVQHVVNHLKALPIPALGASYLQTVPLREVQPGRGRLTLHTASGALAFQAGVDAVLPAIEPGTLSAPLVFAGHGIQEPGLGHDDFRGLDVRGKVVVFFADLPPGEVWRRPDLLEKYAPNRAADRYDSRLALLEKLGARAAIALEEGLDRRLAEGKEPALPYFLQAPGVPASGEPPLARIALTASLRKALTAGLNGTAELSVRGKVRAIQGQNVLGWLEGSDPQLRREAVVVGAHLDHLGMPNGQLHPGADDNASGVSALLEITRTLAIAPVRPKRTVIFAFWTGEEAGEYGSGYYTRHPRWPLAATKAYLNLDMIGHPWTQEELRTLMTESGSAAPKGFLDGLEPTRFAEPGLASSHRDLGPILIQAGKGTGMSLHLDWTDGKNGGSDYRDFARLNLPFVRFFGDYFPEYHQPGDTLDKLDPEQVKRMARLVLATAWLLADR